VSKNITFYVGSYSPTNFHSRERISPSLWLCGKFLIQSSTLDRSQLISYGVRAYYQTGKVAQN